jgi:hypothetical protein
MQTSTAAIKTLSVVALLVTFAVNATSQGETCFYASKGFAADVTFQTHGATCQQCSTQAGGAWIDRIQGCEKIREKQIPGAQPSAKVCSDSDGLAYSEGAIFDDGNQCKRCQNGQWFGLERKAFCKH